jgi:membrane fusion protein, multidrug efflux system
MKKRQLILLGIFLLLSAAIYFRLMSKHTVVEKEAGEKVSVFYLPYRTVENKSKELQISSYGQVNPGLEFDLSFEVQGRLEQGQSFLKPGMKFRKNQLLYKVNNEEAFYTLGARKNQLATLLISAMPDIELDFPSEKGKWMQFLDKLRPAELMPNLPNFASAKERMFFTSRNFLSEYYNIKSLESRMEKYFFLAPFNGTVIEVFTEPGALAGPGVRIAKIAKTGEFEVKVPITLKNLDFFKKENTAVFKNAEGKTVASGRILRISDLINQRTQSVDVYYSLQAVEGNTIYNGMFLTAQIKQTSNESSFTIPRMAMEDNKVQLLSKNKVEERTVQVIGSKPDSLFITGLQNGEKLILERVEEKEVKNKKLVGISR